MNCRNKYGVVYKIINVINNKVYIGITSRSKGFKGRYPYKGTGIERVYHTYEKNKDNGRYYNSHLLNSIIKYGMESFSVDEEFDIAYSEEELKKKEKYWISYYNSNSPKCGYNFTSGGDGVNNKPIISKIKTRIYYAKVKYFYNKYTEYMIMKRGHKGSKCKVCGILYYRSHSKNGFCKYCLQFEDYYKENKKYIARCKKEWTDEMNKKYIKRMQRESEKEELEEQKELNFIMAIQRESI